MPEPKPSAVQELALESVSTRVSVPGVAGDRMADRREVGANLVCAARLQAGLDERIGGEGLDDAEVRARLARCASADGPPLRGPVVAPERRVDRPGARAQPALHQREIRAR